MTYDEDGESPFSPDNLAGQLEYLIDNQTFWLAESMVAISPNRLYMQLISGERFEILITRIDN